jgi:hypothetical protein
METEGHNPILVLSMERDSSIPTCPPEGSSGIPPPPDDGGASGDPMIAASLGNPTGRVGEPSSLGRKQEAI